MTNNNSLRVNLTVDQAFSIAGKMAEKSWRSPEGADGFGASLVIEEDSAVLFGTKEAVSVWLAQIKRVGQPKVSA